MASADVRMFSPDPEIACRCIYSPSEPGPIGLVPKIFVFEELFISIMWPLKAGTLSPDIFYEKAFTPVLGRRAKNLPRSR